MARNIGYRLKKIMEPGKCVKLGVTERLEEKGFSGGQRSES